MLNWRAAPVAVINGFADSSSMIRRAFGSPANFLRHWTTTSLIRVARLRASRSEERRVGKECRSLWWAAHEKKKADVPRKHRPNHFSKLMHKPQEIQEHDNRH